MKCSIITIHHIHNFGSVFQAYALARFLEINGYDAEIIDYRPEYYNWGRNKIKTAVGRMINLVPYCRRKKKFDSFISEHNYLSERVFVNEEQLKHHYWNSDNIFIAGGDQLWNDYHPCGKDNAYKLVFTNSKNKIAYGTSMGRNDFSDETLLNISELLKDFRQLMLREQSTVPMLQKYTGIPVKHVIDPVGLLEKEEFERIASAPPIVEPYAVMYLADSGELLDKTIEHLSKKMGLKIVHICGFRKKCYCDYFEKDTGPRELLGYILNAKFVISASFHATMFSILFNKQFATLLPNEKTNARISDILEYVGLEKRIIHSTEDLKYLVDLIDYSEVNKSIEKLKKKSVELLLTTLSAE